MNNIEDDDYELLYDEHDLWDDEPHPCEMCGSHDADYVEDPYDADIYGEHNMRWLCPRCYNELCDDI